MDGNLSCKNDKADSKAFRPRGKGSVAYKERKKAKNEVKRAVKRAALAALDGQQQEQQQNIDVVPSSSVDRPPFVFLSPGSFVVRLPPSDVSKVPLKKRPQSPETHYSESQRCFSLEEPSPRPQTKKKRSLVVKLRVRSRRSRNGYCCRTVIHCCRSV